MMLAPFQISNCGWGGGGGVDPLIFHKRRFGSNKLSAGYFQYSTTEMLQKNGGFQTTPDLVQGDQLVDKRVPVERENTSHCLVDQ